MMSRLEVRDVEVLRWVVTTLGVVFGNKLPVSDHVAHNFRNHWVNSAVFIGSEGRCHLEETRFRNCYPAYGIST